MCNHSFDGVWGEPGSGAGAPAGCGAEPREQKKNSAILGAPKPATFSSPEMVPHTPHGSRCVLIGRLKRLAKPKFHVRGRDSGLSQALLV